MHSDPRLAIVTGASRGLGLALTRALAERGWRVVADGRDGERLERALSGLPGVTRIPGDVADSGHRTEIGGAAPDGVDLLVNNASALGPSPQPALAAYPLALIQLLLPGLRRRHGSRPCASTRAIPGT